MSRPMHMLPKMFDRLAIGGTTACWEWQGGTHRGYGYVYDHKRKKNQRTHRIAYELWRGPIPADLQLDHLCRNRRCCNPAHLEAVTCRENLMRGESPSAKGARATHCPQGHEYTPENTLPHKKGWRACRQCNLERVQARRALRLAQDAEQETE